MAAGHWEHVPPPISLPPSQLITIRPTRENRSRRVRARWTPGAGRRDGRYIYRLLPVGYALNEREKEKKKTDFYFFFPLDDANFTTVLQTGRGEDRYYLVVIE